MQEDPKPFCPDCTSAAPESLDRRRFLQTLGERAAAVLALSGMAAGLPRLRADEQKAETPNKPAEDLIKEFHGSLSDDQKKELILPWDHGAEDGRRATRLRMYNAPIGGKRIADKYTKPQQELIERILKSISNGEEGYNKISRAGTWDSFGGLKGCGVTMFGELAEGKRFAWVFAGHHLTIRCPGNSEEGAAFGGPMFYGHSPSGYSKENVFYYQTKSVSSVFEALSEEQRKKAIATEKPSEGESSIKFRPKDEAKPGIAFTDLTKDQKQLVETVMRDVVSPYRKEDGDDVMRVVKANGGLEKIHLAFYQDRGMNDKEPWHFWRLEGPGFVWNYRILPHVHTYVNISSKLG